MSYQKIMVCAGRGGTGCSTVAYSLALGLARAGKTTLLLDLDTRERSLDMYLGLEDRVIYDLGDLLSGTTAPCDVAIPHPALPNLLLVAGVYGLTRLPFALELSLVLERLMQDLHADYIVLDTSSEAVSILSGLTDATIVVATPTALGLRSAASFCDTLRGGDTEHLFLCVNRYLPDVIPDLRTLIDKTAIPLIGVIPYDDTIPPLQETGTLPAADTSPVAIACQNMAARLMGAHLPLLSHMGVNRRKWLHT